MAMVNGRALVALQCMRKINTDQGICSLPEGAGSVGAQLETCDYFRDIFPSNRFELLQAHQNRDCVASPAVLWFNIHVKGQLFTSLGDAVLLATFLCDSGGVEKSWSFEAIFDSLLPDGPRQGKEFGTWIAMTAYSMVL